MMKHSTIQRICFVVLYITNIYSSQNNQQQNSAQDIPKIIDFYSQKRYAFMSDLGIQPRKTIQPIIFSSPIDSHNPNLIIRTIQKARLQPAQSNYVWVQSFQSNHYTPYQHIGMVQAHNGQFIDVYEQVDQAPFYHNIRTIDVIVYTYQHQQPNSILDHSRSCIDKTASKR